MIRFSRTDPCPLLHGSIVLRFDANEFQVISPFAQQIKFSFSQHTATELTNQLFCGEEKRPSESWSLLAPEIPSLNSFIVELKMRMLNGSASAGVAVVVYIRNIPMLNLSLDRN